MSQTYSKYIFDHYRDPRNFGILKRPDRVAENLNPLCGDEIKVYIQAEGSKIRGLKYEARGCALSIAAASMLSERIKKQESRIKEVEKLNLDDIEKLLGIKIAPARVQCATLALNTIRKALL